MNTKLDLALNSLYQKQISTRDDLLNEMLRVKMTLNKLENSLKDKRDREVLFQLMKTTTENKLDIFRGNSDDFLELVNVLEDIDPIEYTLEIYKNDRLGTIVSPKYLSTDICEKIEEIQPQTILITEAEKHLSGLRELIKQCKHSQLTLTTQLKSMYQLLQLVFENNQNVIIRSESIYTDCLENQTFDYIYSLPAFGYKTDECSSTFITRDSDGVATENMLGHLSDSGTLDIIIPAKITFASMGYEKLRSFITKNFNVKSIYILPEGTFRPTTAIKTYFFTITKQPQPTIELGTFELNKEQFKITDKKKITTEAFLSQNDWRIELLLSDDDENIQKFKSSHLKKVKLKEVAEVFRGKSILKKDTTLGNISVLNISNIENGKIDYKNMDTIHEIERKIERYKLLSGDVVLSCRGTAIKTAVFESQNTTVIASANLIVVRPSEKIKGDYIKIFFESPIGLAMIKSFQRGTTIMNINHSDIMEIELPLIPIQEQNELIKQYHNELNIYLDAISQAEKRWTQVKDVIYNKLIEEK